MSSQNYKTIVTEIGINHVDSAYRILTGAYGNYRSQIIFSRGLLRQKNGVLVFGVSDEGVYLTEDKKGDSVLVGFHPQEEISWRNGHGPQKPFYLYDGGVLPHARKRGKMTELVAQMEHEAFAKDYTHLYIEVGMETELWTVLDRLGFSAIFSDEQEGKRDTGSLLRELDGIPTWSSDERQTEDSSIQRNVVRLVKTL